MELAVHTLLATLLASGVAIADENVDFSRHDANGDGRLTYDEWKDVPIAFEDVDEDNDHEVSRQEIRNAGLELLPGSQQQAQQLDDKRQNRDAAAQQASTQRTGNRQGKDSFKEADGDKDGRVSRNEARDAGYDYVVMYFDPIDSDGNGFLDEDEWNLNETGSMQYDRAESADITAPGKPDDEDLDAGHWNETAFQRYDANDDGLLDEDEAADDEYVQANFNTWDSNQDGLIDSEEAADSWDSDND